METTLDEATDPWGVKVASDWLIITLRASDRLKGLRSRMSAFLFSCREPWLPKLRLPGSPEQR